MVKVQVNGASHNLGDYVFGQPAATTTAGTTKYSYRELLLCGTGEGSYGTVCGIACLVTRDDLADSFWVSSRSFLVNSKQLNTKRQ